MKTIEELKGKIFIACTACMSVWADGLSWANANKSRITKNPEEAENIIILSCQVTDLAILNDIKTLERYKERFPNKKYFISGCLSKRKDIPLPDFAQRLETPRKNLQPLEDRTLVRFEKPFWVKDFSEGAKEFSQGNLFRKMYPLRIGKGCPFNCSYCTIRITRGDFEQYPSKELEKEFLKFDDILLIADSPMVNQIKEWHNLSLKHNKGFSIRNIEPSIVVKCEAELMNLAKNKLLKVFHSPIQSNDQDVLRDMNRNVEDTLKTIEIAKQLKKLGVFIATNIIVDYKNFKQDFSEVYKTYDYVSWNPLWDNNWDRTRAEQRFKHYLNSNFEVKR